MSLDAMTWAWRQPVRGTQKLVLLALADHADAAWEAWPAIKSLAERCGVTPRAVRDAIRALEDAARRPHRPLPRQRQPRLEPLRPGHG